VVSYNRLDDPEPLVESQNLKKAGLKVTLPRMKILEILETSGSNTHHLTAEDIYRILLDLGEEIGLATVYRVLTQFEAAGLVIRHHFEGGQAVFELDRGRHHDHLVCVKCGRIVEFVDDTIEMKQKQIASSAGFEMTDHALIIYGVCANCESGIRRR
jgi:Fur family ferric uptake transcriptional regulator